MVHIFVTDFLLITVVRARTITGISPVLIPYAKMLDANTHTAVAVLGATGARTT